MMKGIYQGIKGINKVIKKNSLDKIKYKNKKTIKYLSKKIPCYFAMDKFIAEELL